MKFAFALALMLLSACVGQTPVPGGGPPPAADALKLASGDKLKITTYGEPTLTGEFQVTPAGTVAFPLIGDMQAAGLDPAAFARSLEAKLGGGYLLNPKVAVEVLNYRPIYVLGEVQKPGEYPFTPGLTVRGAIAKADGYTYRANQNKVFVKRAGEAGETEYPMTADFAIMPGDTVRFSERYF
ncbi:Polysaccharide export periplasmic protein [Sphingomonas sp. EC-HK361]|uniref:polysaccharide biosynthesis/export family protein n=1 Tax=Sphingomonas sp. EC-HK361 TaxID=2038397 RepID=UPI00125C4786|nr:polysaccharide biosynthesis/export family protein [Sphingomonas sp. EC-HK361]VVT00086.1 Polysaccharide export periplasmic protein [Sphingomonas sp. EC-HK361]